MHHIIRGEGDLRNLDSPDCLSYGVACECVASECRIGM